MNEERKGEAAILSQTVLWGFFPVIATLSFLSLNPVVSLALTTALSTIFFGFMMTYRGLWKELGNWKVWVELFYIAFFIGVVYYGFYYLGLKYTTPGNASLLALSETLFSYLYFTLWHKENFSGKHVVGSLLMLLGAALVLFPHATGFNKGDLLIFLSTLFPPIGNYFQQKIRKKVHSETLMFGRSLLSLPFLVVFSLVLARDTSWSSIRASAWFLVLNGVVFFGVAKILWLEGIHRISVTKANALSAVGPLFTLIFAFIILKQTPTIWQLAAFIPFSAGLFLLTKNPNR